MCSQSTEGGSENSLSDLEQLQVLDLPQLHRKPAASTLLAILAQLSLNPTSWDRTITSTTNNATPSSINEDGIPSYLTRIISSSLDWIPSDEDKEAIWEAASTRLAERAGRTAMPSLTRTFHIPLLSRPRSPVRSANTPKAMDITIHEPSLTGDNLGHKTWVAAYLLAKRLPSLLQRRLARPSRDSSTYAKSRHPALLSGVVSRSFEKTSEEIYNVRDSPPDPAPSSLRDSRPGVLELGAGTGLVGLAASALFPVNAHLTDLEPIIPNLQRNIQENIPLTYQSTITAGTLDWSSPHPVLPEHERYNIILAADSLYAPEHAQWLAKTMDSYLKEQDEDGRIIVELPFRETYPPEHEQFKREMESHSFKIENQGEEVGFDDWGDHATGEGMEVKCWWSIWRRVKVNHTSS